MEGCHKYAKSTSCDYHRQKAFKEGKSLTRTRIEYSPTIIPKNLFLVTRHYEDYAIDLTGVGTTKKENYEVR